MTEGWINYARKYVAKREAPEPNRLPNILKKRQQRGEAIVVEDFLSGLVDNEAGVRERALDALSGVLQGTEDSAPQLFSRLWEGLFLCFWNTDRPLTQLDVANRIAALLHSVRNADGNARRLLWLQTFFETLLTNWPKLDVHRLDKYYSLCRRVLCEAFRFLGEASTTAEDRQRFYEIITTVLRSPLVAISMHLADIWLEEAIEASLAPALFTESLQLWLDAVERPGPLQQHILLRVFNQRLFRSKAAPLDRDALQHRVEAMLDESKGKRRLVALYQILHGLGALPPLFEDEEEEEQQEEATEARAGGKRRRRRNKSEEKREKAEGADRKRPHRQVGRRPKAVRKAQTKKRQEKEQKRRGKKAASGLHGSRRVQRSSTVVFRGTVADML